MMTPDVTANTFFKIFMANQFNDCFEMFSKHSQGVFLDWTLKFIYAQHPEAAKSADLTTKEVRILFQRNDTSLMKSFWKQFYFCSGALEIYRFGYFSLASMSGNEALVNINLQYPDGRSGSLQVKMLKEGKHWRFGYMESGLRFP
jgi:hypothetical protein